jgi:ABC-type transporter lipoprotein component MlaA
MKKIIKILILIIFCFSQTLCVYADSYGDDEFDMPEKIIVYDPFKIVNRKILDFNLLFYKYLLIPSVDIYEKVTPLSLRWSLKNIAMNYVSTPKDVVLSVIDCDLEAAAISFWRFLINSTLGIFGVIDVATKMNLNYYGKDLNLVMQFYRIPNGPYLMIPFLGPYTTRGFTSLIIENMLYPYNMRLIFGWYFIMPETFAAALTPFYFAKSTTGNMIDIFNSMYRINLVNSFVNAKTKVSLLNQSAIDIYETYKTFYYQLSEKRFEDYKKIKSSKQIKSKNKCDNEISIMLPAECHFEENGIY